MNRRGFLATLLALFTFRRAKPARTVTIELRRKTVEVFAITDGALRRFHFEIPLPPSQSAWRDIVANSHIGDA
jgi:hypothetical protein